MITGITGQDGAYLARLLLSEGYEVYGTSRQIAPAPAWRLREMQIEPQVTTLPMDLLDFDTVLQVIEKTRPDEVYNLAAQSSVGLSFAEPLYTGEADALGAARLLEAGRVAKPDARFYQASTSEMYGRARETPQNEQTPFCPRSPYGVAKLYAHWMTVHYREAHSLHASAGILFNHESELRGPEFVTRKITLSLARIKHGQQDVLALGNLEARRDWGFAGDFVRGMWRMVRQPEADDYVLATGATHSVREFAEQAAACVGYTVAWEGEGVHARGIDRRTGKVLVRVIQ